MNFSHFRPLSCVWFVLSLALTAQTTKAVKIEKKLKLRLESREGATTLGMVQAFDEASLSYAGEIGRIYQKLKHELPPPQRDTLIKSQLAWQEYLKTYRQFVSYVYDAPGSMHKHMAMSYLKDMLQHRLEELCCFFMRAQDEFDEEVPTSESWCSESHGDLRLSDPLSQASQAEKQGTDIRPRPGK